MAKAGNLSFNPIFNPCHPNPIAKAKTFRLLSHVDTNNNAIVTVSASTKKKDKLPSPLIGKNTSRPSRRLITISPSDGKYHGDWTSDYFVSLRDLHLQDLIEVKDDPRRNAEVFIKLSIQKHASFGLSVDTRVTTSFTAKCSNCSSPYCRQIDLKFNVWVLRAAREKRKMQLPEIGDDPYVIYARPGYEVDLDSLIQDAIRLNSFVKNTCSDSCEKSEGTIQFTTGQSQASFDKRWSRLLELKNSLK